MTIELKVVSEQRDGLLLALGEVLLANQFKLLRHRRANTDRNVVMVLVVQGPESRLLALEEQLGTHWMVRSFEAAPYEPGVSTSPQTLAEVVASIDPAHADVPPPRPAPAAPAAAPPAPAAPDPARVEVLLPQLARDYPRVFGLVLGFERSLEPAQRATTMRYVGTRVGAWVYKRDFALGAALDLSRSIKHIALPAMRQLLPTEPDGDALMTNGSPFCVGSGHSAAAQCHFLCGFLEGLLNESGKLPRVRVSETACRAGGAAGCRFVFDA
ncbi:V4R domain-containing protein [Luteimonas sp. R10]|uniref:V4R domain-containing protein n=1 Tax=Luteimonas sp. R10 TaxID=3108176 RepID=UPI00308B6DC6|nr:4-vinyl reductase [Luteimonas sp. R10]